MNDDRKWMQALTKYDEEIKPEIEALFRRKLEIMPRLRETVLSVMRTEVPKHLWRDFLCENKEMREAIDHNSKIDVLFAQIFCAAKEIKTVKYLSCYIVGRVHKWLEDLVEDLFVVEDLREDLREDFPPNLLPRKEEKRQEWLQLLNKI